MSKLIGVRVNKWSNVVYCDPGELEVDLFDKVEIELNKNVVSAEVIISPDQVIYSEIETPVNRVIRKITKDRF
ncbi:MAG: hypothetical protein FI729_04575 [SAR202 cluster bacterium]|nr:hypothetical protein [SAR202 cluster bacterium]